MSGADVIIVCGVSGCGKTTIAKALADTHQLRFVEGDAHHPERNVEKMAAGIPLTDNDRTAWLDSICTDLELNPHQKAVLACSALTPYVQNFLKDRLESRINWVKLEISPEAAKARMEDRDHFMPPSLLKTQFDAWHPPEDGLTVSAEQNVEKIINVITNYLELTGS